MSRSNTRGRPTVISKHGRFRFQSGMITASLLERGVGMNDAFALSRELRKTITDLKEVTSDELEERLQVLIEARLGMRVPKPRAVAIPPRAAKVAAAPVAPPIAPPAITPYLTPRMVPAPAMLDGKRVRKW